MKECPVCGKKYEGEKSVCHDCYILAQTCVIFVSVDYEKSQATNTAVRTGHYFFISEYSHIFMDLVENFPRQLLQNFVKNRFCYVDYNLGKDKGIFDNPQLLN